MIFGAAGMLGHKLCQRLSADDHEVTGTVRRQPDAYRRFGGIFGRTRLLGGVDALDFSVVERLLADHRPEAVINCIGVVTQLIESNSRYVAVGLNSFLPQVLERACGRIGARLVHFSTDCVFSGRRGRYTEADLSDAEDIYGRTKFLGEPDGAGNATLTIRSSVVGREIASHTHGLFEWFLGQSGKSVQGFTRAIFTGFTTIEMSNIVAMALANPEPLRGTYHVASAPVNKFDLLCLFRDIGGHQIDIQPDESFRCDRSLMMDRFAADSGYVAPDWKSMIETLVADPTPYDTYRRPPNI